ncbi:MAG: o-succinylbenzoate synthase [Actinobacteria bacterium]|nr:o-succinylbenzoate synthase [Actinomycetota bacterium]
MTPGARAPLPEVALVDVEVLRCRLALVHPFVSAHGTESAKEVLLARAVDAEGREGWGECAALARPSYTGEWIDGAEAVLRRFLVPAALAGRPAGVVGHPMASAALEAAVLHLRLATAGSTMASWVGAVRDRVACGVAVGIAGSVDELLAEVAASVADGYQRVKLKVRPGWDAEPVRAVRGAWPDLALGVDANGSYGRSDLDGPLAALDHLGLVEIEQPLAADDLVGLAETRRRLTTPVCLDESIGSAADLETALALAAVDHVNLKPGRVGGVAEALRIHDLALDRGVPLWIGGMLDTGVAKAVNVALAALPGACLPGDLPASRRWFAEDLTDPWEVAPDGTMAVRPLGGVRVAVGDPRIVPAHRC